LGLADTPADAVGAARSDFAKGLFRRGLAILNNALQENPQLVEAWILKSWFLNSVGFNGAAAEMLEGAILVSTNQADRIQLFEERAFVCAESIRGEEALASADAALALGSNSVRTHYLRGRALALVGRLAEARDEMNHVLGLDPHNADAQRALKMIEDALRSEPPRRWWQVWKR
jgi:tetratricopeptide (TPR) repeat protein